MSCLHHAFLRFVSGFPVVLFGLGLALLPAGKATAGLITIGTIDSLSAAATFIDLQTGSKTESFAAPAAVGDYRTLSLAVDGSGRTNVFWGVDDELPVPSLALSSPAGKTATFSLLWGGAGGTAGLGGVNFKPDGQAISDLSLSFNLLSIDQDINLIWTFTDTTGKVATYSKALAPKSATTPAEQVLIGFSEFSGSGEIDWSSINFIAVSGGGVPELDVQLTGAVSVVSSVPEPTLLPLCCGLAAAAGLFIRRRQES